MNNILEYNGIEYTLSNSMLLFLDTIKIENLEFAKWSFVGFDTQRIQDCQSSEVYIDIEFITPLQYTNDSKIKMIDPDDQLFLRSVHVLKIEGQEVEIKSLAHGAVNLIDLNKKADFISISAIVEVNGNRLLLNFDGKSQLIVMNNE